MTINNFQPQDLINFFKTISSIVPRISGQEKVISDFMVDFAKKRNLEVFQDQAYNVIIKKPATQGYEEAPTVILQAHMDMVTEKNQETQHDFTKDPLKLLVENGWLTAQGTTLGADDGAGVAMILTVLNSSQIEHPPLEVILSTSEETGMTGILQFNPSLYNLKGSYLINLDTGEECSIGISCLGGCRTDMRIPYTKQNIQGQGFHISIRGLKGGHSGENIDDGLGNANKLLGRFLSALMLKVPFLLADISGGGKENAIPRESDAFIFIKLDSDVQVLKDLVKEYNTIYKQELALTDPDILMSLHTIEKSIDNTLDLKSTQVVINILNAHPNGVLSRNFYMDKMPQTSLNTAVIVKEDSFIRISSNVRSSVPSELQSALSMLESLANLVGGTFGTRNCYSPWQYDAHSKLRPLVSKLAIDVFGKEAQSFAIQGGTEVGVIKGLLGGKLDCISIGPTMVGIHTPDEKLNLESFAKTYQWLVSILKAIKV